MFPSANGSPMIDTWHVVVNPENIILEVYLERYLVLAQNFAARLERCTGRPHRVEQVQGARPEAGDPLRKPPSNNG